LESVTQMWEGEARAATATQSRHAQPHEALRHDAYLPEQRPLAV